jgi:hypothetical protein
LLCMLQSDSLVIGDCKCELNNILVHIPLRGAIPYIHCIIQATAVAQSDIHASHGLERAYTHELDRSPDI